MPYNWTVHVTDGGAEIASLNCLECHAGYFDGELVVGLGRADAGYTSNFGSDLAQLVPNLPVPGTEELARFAERHAVLGPHVEMRTIGRNPADDTRRARTQW